MKKKVYINCNLYKDNAGGNNIGRIFSVSAIPKSLVCTEDTIDLMKIEDGKLLNVSIPTIME